LDGDISILVLIRHYHFGPTGCHKHIDMIFKIQHTFIDFSKTTGISMLSIFFCVYSIFCLSMQGAEQDRFTITGDSRYETGFCSTILSLVGRRNSWQIVTNKKLAEQFGFFKTEFNKSSRTSNVSDQFSKYVVQNLLSLANQQRNVDSNDILTSYKDLGD